jgi:hypothetical protein
MTNKTKLPPLYFSYNQFTVFDRKMDEVLRKYIIELSGEHLKQGFGRTDSIVVFRSIIDHGWADVFVVDSLFVREARHLRAISVPFSAVSGVLTIDSPDDMRSKREWSIDPGNYYMTVAQSLIEEKEIIELFFEKTENLPQRSQVIVCDGDLTPPARLLETINLIPS